MKKKELNKQHQLLRQIFGKRCYDLRCDDEANRTNGCKTSYKSTSMQQLATLFSAKIKDKYDTSKISRLENYTAEVTILDLYLYHKHYNVSYNYLMGNTENKREQYNGAWEKYGLSDKTLDILNNLAKTNRYEKEIFVLNELFESGLVQPLLNTLYDYLHNDYENRLPSGYKPTNGELVEVELIAKAGKLNLGSDIFPLEKLNSLNKQILYDKLEELKQVLNDKQNPENKRTQNKISKKILDNIYKNKT